MLMVDYQRQLSNLFEGLPAKERLSTCRLLARTDLFFLLTAVLNRRDLEREWLFQRTREVQANPDGYIDLWAREHYKSTIITFALTIQNILASHGRNPLPQWEGREACIGIFSHTRPAAKAFLQQIKREFESNPLLLEWFPDIVWANPKRDAPKWSEDEGIILRRQSNPKEATVEAWGVLDGQPTGKHFSVLVYDDLVTRDTVGTPEMINKTTEMVELSFNLGMEGGKRRFIGTRYHFNDTYRTLLERGTVTPRLYPATEDGTPDGEPVLLTREALVTKRRDMGPYTFACQMLQNPVVDSVQGFRREWIGYNTNPDPTSLNRYILVDAANGKRPLNDYTAMWVIGLGPDRNYYVLDMVRDRLNLTERTAVLMNLHRKWKPLEVRYERYGLMADIQHIEDVQARENYRFRIVEVGGAMPKPDRIKRLVPEFEQGKFYLPHTLNRVGYDRKTHNLVHDFIEEEYMAFPVGSHDDMLDALARLMEPDLPLRWPEEANLDYQQSTFDDRKGRSAITGY